MSNETLLLVEDNDSVALVLQYGLEKEGFHVLRAADMAEARELAHSHSFELAILDVRLPDGSGFDLCREFREAGMRQPILMLTARHEVINKILGLELGADDYMAKPYELRELVARIRALLRRSYGELAERPPTSLRISDLDIDLTTQRVLRDETQIHLTATEFKLLAFLAQNSGQPFSRESLLEKVWGYEDFVGDARTVDVHIRNLRQKVELNPTNPKLVVTVRGSGYKLVR